MLVTHLPLLDSSSQKGDLKKGMDQVRNYLREKEAFENFILQEPSGLSRENRLSPRDIKNSLISFHKVQYQPEMMSSYPLAQSPGTLSQRFQNLASDSFVRAKTGSLYRVIGLAGWIGSKDTKQYHFVFIYNGQKTNQAKELFDQSLLFLIQ